MEDRIGSPKPEKLADLVIIDADLTSINPAHLPAAPLWVTVLDGQVRHALDPGSLGL